MKLGPHLKLSKQISNAHKELVPASSIHCTNLHRAGLSLKNESKTVFLNYHHDFGLRFFSKQAYRGLNLGSSQVTCSKHKAHSKA